MTEFEDAIRELSRSIQRLQLALDRFGKTTIKDWERTLQKRTYTADDPEPAGVVTLRESDYQRSLPYLHRLPSGNWGWSEYEHPDLFHEIRGSGDSWRAAMSVAGSPMVVVR